VIEGKATNLVGVSESTENNEQKDKTQRLKKDLKNQKRMRKTVGEMIGFC
jgi:hypothetical protein